MHATSPTDAPPEATPDPIPASMLAAATYCERLCYLEWGQGEKQENEHTLEGKRLHQRVHASRGDLQAPLDQQGQREQQEQEGDASEPRPYEARSLWLASVRLGISAMMDLVEGQGGTVTPVEYKKGSKPDVSEGAWPSQRVQVCAQVLLLRDQGYVCQQGEIYFAADRVRVPIAIDDELVTMTLDAARRAREILAQGELPPPLKNSPKCPGCSLASICLPDEVGLLSDPAADDEQGDGPRRLFPARPDALPVYVQEHGSYVGKKGDRLEVRSRAGKVLADAPLLKVSNLSLFANAQVSPAVIKELASRSVPICHFSTGGYFYAVTHGMGTRNVELRQRQFAGSRDGALSLALARSFVEGKVRNQRTLLRRNAREPVAGELKELRQSARRALEAAEVGSLLGVEGNAARVYFQSFRKMLAPDRTNDAAALFDFTSRNRRPPRDPINAMLSFVYAILVKDLTVTLFAAGFDPFLGFFHTPHHGRPSLALDLAEEFRPIIGDSVVVTLVNNGEVGPRDFIRRVGSCGLSPSGRKAVLKAYERRMDTLVTHPVFGYSISYRRILEVQVRLLGRFLFREIPNYPTFRTR